MDKETMLNRVRDAIIELNIDDIKDICQKALEYGIPAYEVVINGMAGGMKIVGEKYEAGEYYLAELVTAGETMKEGMKILEPHMKAGESKSPGTCVIGTVKGDIHDIGKNVFVTLLKSQNYNVVDLGTDVSASVFVQAVKEHRPKVLAMSALLTTTMVEMENIVKEMKKQGLRDGLKIIFRKYSPARHKSLRW